MDEHREEREELERDVRDDEDDAREQAELPPWAEHTAFMVEAVGWPR